MGSTTENFKVLFWDTWYSVVNGHGRYGSTPESAQKSASEASHPGETSGSHGSSSENSESSSGNYSGYNDSGSYESGSSSSKSSALGGMIVWGALAGAVVLAYNYVNGRNPNEVYQAPPAEQQFPTVVVPNVPERSGQNSNSGIENKTIGPTETGVTGTLLPIGSFHSEGFFWVVDSVQLYYGNGRYYHISRDKYPKFYEKLDLNKDSLVTLQEMFVFTFELNDITKKYPVGDIEDIVREFTSKK